MAMASPAAGPAATDRGNWMGQWACKVPYFSQDCKAADQCGVKDNVRLLFVFLWHKKAMFLV